MPTVAVGTGGVTGQSVGRIARSAFFLRLDGFDIMIIEICGREMDVQIIERIGQCNGCSACILGCRERAIKMIADENGNKYIERDTGAIWPIGFSYFLERYHSFTARKFNTI